MSKCIELIYSNGEIHHETEGILSRDKLKEIFPNDEYVTLKYHYQRRRFRKHEGKDNQVEERSSSPKFYTKNKKIRLK